ILDMKDVHLNFHFEKIKKPTKAINNKSGTSLELKANLSFLLDYIEGKPYTNALIEMFEKQQGRFMVNQKLMGEWKRAVRAVQAAMIKHGGIASLARQYCQQQTNASSHHTDEEHNVGIGGDKENWSPSFKRKTAIEKLSSNDLRILSERVRVIANAIKPLALPVETMELL
ncbi:hypothetical protein RFI_38639, partial [Reticulomyxa filosa]